MTKSNDKILLYKNHEFTIPIEEKEGYKLDDTLDKIAHEMTKIDFGVPEIQIKDAFLEAYEKRKKELKQLKLK